MGIEADWFFSRDDAADVCFQAASFFNTPLSWGGRCILHVVSGLARGHLRPDFFSNRVAEVLWRIPLFLVGLPVGFFGIFAAIPGYGFQVLGCALQTRKFSVVGSPSGESVPGRISLLWWNVAGIAGGVSRFQGGLPDCESRVELIADMILRQNCDIVGLTEVYSKGFQNQLAERLRARGYQIVKNVGYGMNPVIAPSGLFLATRVPIQDLRFTPFKECDAFEARKGFLSCTVQVGGRAVRVIATHLKDSKAEENPIQKEKDRRAAQLAEIAQTEGEKRAILMGDLNICQPEEKGSVLDPFWRPSQGEDPTKPTYTNAGKREICPSGALLPVRDVEIDYIRARRESGLRVTVTRVDESLQAKTGLRLSDHWAHRAQVFVS